MRLRGLGHLPRVRGREEAYPPSEAAVRVGEATTQPSSRVWAAFSARFLLTQSRPSLVVGRGGPLALAGAKGGPGFFCANPRGNRSGIGFPAPSGGATRMEGVGFAIGGP